MASTLVGTIEDIWVYPISSLGGQRLTSAALTATGIPGDRSWCIVDAETGVPASPETDQRWRSALFLRSRYGNELPSIGFPDNEWLSVDDKGLKPKLNAHFSFPVDVRRYGEASIDEAGTSTVVANRYEPSPVHLLTTSSLDNLSKLMGAEKPDVRRFRPTIVVRSDGGPDFLEQRWLDRELRIGSTLLRATEETKRCGMTLIAQPGLAEEADILRTVVRHNRRNLGIYCAVAGPGSLETGDEVHLLDYE